MLYQKEGFPEEDEFVLVTVSKIHYHSVFCNLDEYGGKTGLIHISEIAPGRIRNMREYVQEGKKVVCKVLRVDEEKKHIDLSLRRVNEAQKKAKLELIKQEQKAEKIIESLAERLNKDVREIYNAVTKALFPHYEMLFMAFEDVVEEDADLAGKGLDKGLAEPLMELVKEKIKPKEVSIGGDLQLYSFAEDGLDVVRNSLQKAEKEKGVSVSYSGAGRYRVMVTAPDYKEAEKHLTASVEAAKAIVEKSNGGKADFKRR